ncbi:MAG: response regulator transcription factor [Actinomycetales bacterium]|nr:response regulator transcription factor [Actinomycetales bacterium]
MRHESIRGGRTGALHIWVVDDDAAIGRALRRALEFEGHRVTVLTDGASLLARLGVPDPVRAPTNRDPAADCDLLLLDLGLPDQDGLTVLTTLRAAGQRLPVLVLTARGAVADRVAGLDAGADDYLVKPFALDELLARLRALVRRSPRDVDDDPLAGLAMPAPEILRVGDLTLQPDSHEVSRAGMPIALTRTEFALLEVLLRNAGIVVRREVLLDRVWGWSSDTLSNSLDVYMGYLRRKTEVGGHPRLLHTVRGVGYVARPAPP